MTEAIQNILLENERRNKVINAPFNPISGKGSILDRKEVFIEDFPIPTQYLPVSMLKVPLIKKLIKAGSVRNFLKDVLKVGYSETDRLKVIEQVVRIRIKHDFCFWAAMYVYIKPKGGGELVRFVLSRPQRKFLTKLEEIRLKNKPIRIVLLKARQWGGSTTSQLYMAWLQLVHKKGLNSLIIAHQTSASDEIKDMFDQMIENYPINLLYEIDDIYNENEKKIEGVGKSGLIHRVPQRKCKIKLGTAERPDSCRGGDYNLVHLSEVGVWKETEGKTPEEIIQSACSGVLLKPFTMIVMESTAKGVGNLFHTEYNAAKDGTSQFEPLFISWFDIDEYSLPIDDCHAFAKRL